jgi:phytoene dehydrogenase-like protein
MRAYDAVVIGGGHNGLAAAAYLGRAGMRVLVLERRERVGGAAASAAPFEGRGERVSSYAYLVSLLPPAVARDLGIRVELRTRRVSAFAPTPDGGLIVDEPPTSQRTADAFRRLSGSGSEHSAWLEFDALMAAIAARIFPTLTRPLPSRAAARALLADVPGAWELIAERPLGRTLAERFGDGLVRGVLSTDGLIGTFASVHEQSLRQNRCFLYHVIGGRWRVPVGGMGAIADALLTSARGAGAEIRTGTAVEAVEHGPGTSEVRWDGGAARAGYVLAGVAPGRLAELEGRVPEQAPEGSQTKLNLLLDRLPRLRCGVAPEDAFAGTFRLAEHEDDLEAAYRAAAVGEIPRRAPAEIYCHTLADRTPLGPGAPPGLQSLTLFGLHTPARLFRGDAAAARDLLVARYLDGLDEHLAEPIRDCLARDSGGHPCIEAKSPLDVEHELGMPGGNIFHGDLAWPWTDEGGGWGVETAHPRTFLCGSGARRGGGVSCVGGHNAAMAVIEDARGSPAG